MPTLLPSLWTRNQFVLFRDLFNTLEFCNRYDLNNLNWKEFLLQLSRLTVSLWQCSQALDARILTARKRCGVKVAGWISWCLSHCFSPLSCKYWTNLRLNKWTKFCARLLQSHSTARKPSESITCFAQRQSLRSSSLAIGMMQTTLWRLLVLKLPILLWTVHCLKRSQQICKCTCIRSYLWRNASRRSL